MESHPLLPPLVSITSRLNWLHSTGRKLQKLVITVDDAHAFGESENTDLSGMQEAEDQMLRTNGWERVQQLCDKRDAVHHGHYYFDARSSTAEKSTFRSAAHRRDRRDRRDR